MLKGNYSYTVLLFDYVQQLLCRLCLRWKHCYEEGTLSKHSTSLRHDAVHTGAGRGVFKVTPMSVSSSLHFSHKSKLAASKCFYIGLSKWDTVLFEDWTGVAG